ncbi:MAG: hypothetical protein PHI79_06280 [Sulfurovaceae bacterium]|nr:hypothetical protein [Sulfurovaceae bacterium]MDD5549185.1 hypothetical protein [Sulfurovaceae bacterium]
MKKVVLSTVAMVALSSFASANTEIDALRAQMTAMQNKISELESKQKDQDEAAKKTTGTIIKSKAPVIEFSGTNYLGFVSSKKDGGDRVNNFESRRNYIQTKAYFKENPKDYVRVTLDTFQQNKDTASDDTGSWEVRLKYAYLYLDNILPYTGVEIGQAHRPWIDYEEHNAWNYRSISKVLVEDKLGADWTNSADLGVNFQTKTPYFSSELGLFNGEGYHGTLDTDNDNGLSAEWRMTAHILGTGQQKAKSDLQYANVSFFGQMNQDNKKGIDLGGGNYDDFNWYGFHAVYNQPEFLVAAQYIKSQDAAVAYAGKGYSVNGEYRINPDWSVIGRYDKFDLDDGTDKSRKLAGIGYAYNKNVKLIANYLQETDTAGADKDSIMLTADIDW